MEDSEDSSICSSTAANWTSIMDYNESLHITNLPLKITSNISIPVNITTDTSSGMPAAVMIPTGIMLYVLSLLTFVGNIPLSPYCLPPHE